MFVFIHISAHISVFAPYLKSKIVESKRCVAWKESHVPGNKSFHFTVFSFPYFNSNQTTKQSERNKWQ